MGQKERRKQEKKRGHGDFQGREGGNSGGRGNDIILASTRGSSMFCLYFFFSSKV